MLAAKSLRWQAKDEKLQEAVTSLTDQYSGITGKLEHLTNTLANLQLLLLNNDKGKTHLVGNWF